MGITTYRGRLVISYSLLTFISMLALFSVFYFIAVKKINSLTDDLLLKVANDRLLELKDHPGKYAANEVIEIFGESSFKVIRTDIGALLKSFDMPKDSFINPEFLKQVRVKGNVYKTVVTPAGNVRTLFVSIDENNIIQVTLPLSAQENLLVKTRNFFISMTVIALLLSPMIGWILAGAAINPVIKLTEDAHIIASNNLKERLDVKQKGVEFSNLSLAFNSILERIERFNENQKRFVSDISHEIRSPLTAIKGNIEVTLRRRRSVEEYEEALKRSLHEIDRIILIANNLLFLTKADTGAIELNLREFNLRKLLERVVVNKQHIISDKQLNIEDKLDDIIFNGDEFLLAQLFSNLFDNAIHYTPVEGTISVKASKADNGVTVSIKDTGVGIPPNEIEKIFDRFYRGRQNLNMHETGSGLGLYLARWIVEAHKGQITVESNVGEGSIFHVYLPLTKSIISKY